MPVEPHNRIIRDVAREVLTPFGLRQKGRSRTWLADRGWSAIIVEFQPSGFLRGTYLNVGIHWMWHTIDAISYDVGGREGDGATFVSEEQFTEAARAMARTAVTKIRKYGSLCLSVSSAARWLLWRPMLCYDVFGSDWDLFHAAIGAGLVGRRSVSRFYFRLLLRRRAQHDWQMRRDAAASELARCVNDVGLFRTRVSEMVHKHRTAIGMRVWTEPLFDDK
jgi:hypothetical protein